jgi:hypothetical protein
MKTRISKWLIIITTFVSLLFVVTGLEAEKGGGGKGKPDKPPAGTMTPVANTAYWDGLVREETPIEEGGGMVPRSCGCGGYPNPQGGAAFVCHAGELFPLMNNLLNIDLVGVPAYDTRGSEADDLCGLLFNSELFFNVQEGFTYEGFTQDPENLFTSRSRSYYYSMDPTWIDGPCYEGSDVDANCNVKVYTQAYFVYDDCVGRKCGRLVELEGWGHATPIEPDTPGDVLEFNPFLVSQEIDIEEMTIYFRGLGKDKRVATCKYVFGEDSPVVFFNDTDGATNCSTQ